MAVLGRHFIADLRKCNKEKLNNLGLIKKYMFKAAGLADATVVDSHFRKFTPQGISGVIIIAESHLSIHTWPEYNYAAIDVYTCGENLKPGKAIEYLIDQLESKNPHVIEIKRG